MDVNVMRSLRIAFNLDDEDRKALSKAYAIFDKVRDVMNENQLSYLRASSDDEGFWDDDIDAASKVADMLATTSEWEE